MRPIPKLTRAAIAALLVWAATVISLDLVKARLWGQPALAPPSQAAPPAASDPDDQKSASRVVGVTLARVPARPPQGLANPTRGAALERGGVCHPTRIKFPPGEI
jgi:hypothetical protein